MLWMDFWTSVHEVGSCTKWWGTVVRIDSSIDSIDILRFWHRFLSIPLIRYFRQAWSSRSPTFDSSRLPLSLSSKSLTKSIIPDAVQAPAKVELQPKVIIL